MPAAAQLFLLIQNLGPAEGMVLPTFRTALQTSLTREENPPRNSQGLNNPSRVCLPAGLSPRQFQTLPSGQSTLTTPVVWYPKLKFSTMANLLVPSASKESGEKEPPGGRAAEPHAQQALHFWARQGASTVLFKGSTLLSLSKAIALCWFYASASSTVYSVC